jgi:ABC-type lipoprotein export system ATPase subunit
LFGEDVTRARGSALRTLRRTGIAWVPQRPAHGLFPHLTAIENLVQITRTRGRSTGLEPGAVLEMLALSHRADARPSRLSGGEQQRLAIAAALTHAPDLVVADEPTAELDDENAERVIKALTAIAANGTTCVLSTHDSRALRQLPRVLHLRHGVLSAERAGAELNEDSGLARTADAVIDSAGRLQLPPEALRLFPGRRATVSIEGGDVVLRSPDAVVAGDQPTASQGQVASSQALPSGGPLRSAPASAAPVLSTPVSPGPVSSGPVSSGPVSSGPVSGGPARLAVADVSHGVLNGVSLTAEPATLVALTGHSGSGKSTLCHLIAGFERPEHGTVALDGKPTADVANWSRIAVVPQRLALLAELSGLENLLLPAVAAGRPAEPAQAAELLERLGVAVLATRPVGQGSIGEQQRVAVARALLLTSPLVVLDEPTAHQDDDNARRVIEAILLAVGQGSLVITSTHDPRVLTHATSSLALGSGS